MKTSNRHLLGLIAFYIFYLFIGATIFDALESPHEDEMIRELNLYVQQFRRTYNSCLDANELNEFIRVISIANDKGVPATRNVSKDQNWSFGHAVFFAGTVLTTIGYGNVSPLTKLGKMFCILFALIGIPATLLLLYAIIERLMKFTSFLLNEFTDKLQPFLNSKIALANQRISRSHMHVAFTLTCALFVLVFFFVIPAAIYVRVEGWSYLNAFYYCFISLSTVGLGDYVPGESEDQQYRHLYKLGSTVYLITGVMVMVWLLQIFSETPEFNIYEHFTLVKDGLLTRHRDTTHMACSFVSAGTIHLSNEDASSAVT